MQGTYDPDDFGGAEHEETKRRLRTGWAEASREIAAAGEDALVWPEFGSAEDEDLVGQADSARRLGTLAALREAFEE